MPRMMDSVPDTMLKAGHTFLAHGVVGSPWEEIEVPKIEVEKLVLGHIAGDG